MKRHYEINVRASAVVYVAEARDEAEAFQLARDALNAGDFEDLEMSAMELKTKEEQLSSQLHANAWSAP